MRLMLWFVEKDVADGDHQLCTVRELTFNSGPSLLVGVLYIIDPYELAEGIRYLRVGGGCINAWFSFVSSFSVTSISVMRLNCRSRLNLPSLLMIIVINIFRLIIPMIGIRFIHILIDLVFSVIGVVLEYFLVCIFPVCVFRWAWLQE